MKNFIGNPLFERTLGLPQRVLLTLAVVSCAPVESTELPPKNVTLGQLIEEPRVFDGSDVSVSGYVSLSSERGAIFDSEASASDYDIALAIRILPSSEFSRVEDVDGTHAKISGTFHAEDGGAGPWIGTIVLREVSVGRRYRPHRTPDMAEASPDSGRAMFEQMSKESAQLQSEWERRRENPFRGDQPLPARRE